MSLKGTLILLKTVVVKLNRVLDYIIFMMKMVNFIQKEFHTFKDFTINFIKSS